MTMLLRPFAAPLTAEAETDPESGVTYLEAGEIQLSIGPDGLLLATVPISDSLLVALAALVDHPMVRARITAARGEALSRAA
jgi:hypothetical protein